MQMLWNGWGGRRQRLVVVYIVYSCGAELAIVVDCYVRIMFIILIRYLPE